MAFDDFASGASTGAGIGGTIGSFVPGIGTAIGAGLGGLFGGAAGGLFGRSKPKETKIQRSQRELVDQLLNSLKGDGPYSSLFTPSEEDFNRSFADPARQRFASQTAPQIQQSYIAGGQQRSTGLEDTLARAGVDMDQLLNQQYMQYAQGKEQNKMNALNQILGQGPGVGPKQSPWEAAGQGVAGYLSAPAFGQDISNILSSFSRPSPANAQTTDSMSSMMRPPSKGFEQENEFYNPYKGA